MLEITDAIDVHVHAGPELFARIGDAVEIAERARALGMSGFVCKCHHEPTMTRALLAERAVPGIHVWGGLVLNGFVGGINPIAVAAALESGAKIVWMPTMHARNHIEILGAGTYGIRTMTLPPEATMRDGITALDDSGTLTGDARSVIKLVAEAGAAIGTGHLSQAEVVAVAEEAARVGARCVLTHAYFPDHSDETLMRVAQTGAFIEVSAVIAYPMCRHFGHSMTLETARQLMEAVGFDQIVVSTDAGQVHNPWPPDIMRAFGNALVGIGLKPEDVRTMLTDNPRKLLGLGIDEFLVSEPATT